MASISKDSVKDAGKVRLGAGMKRSVETKVASSAAASVKDTGKVRLGAGMKRS